MKSFDYLLYSKSNEPSHFLLKTNIIINIYQIKIIFKVVFLALLSY